MFRLAMVRVELAGAKGRLAGAILAPATLPMLARHAATLMTSMNENYAHSEDKGQVIEG
jgi:hypothetical protein